MLESATAECQRTDKRRLQRAGVSLVEVEVQADVAPGAPDVARAVNLSEGGMLFTSLRPYTISQVLRLTFVVPDVCQRVRTNATVVHGYADQAGQYVGVCFSALEDFEATSIRCFVTGQPLD